MKKPLLIITVAFLIIILSLVGIIINNNSINAEIQRYNSTYEQYLGQELLGVNIATIMNKATEENKKNDVAKDEKGRYIDDGENSIRIAVKMGEEEKIYPMESITAENGIIFFVQHYSLIKFKCTGVYYHKKTGKVSEIIFEEVVIEE